MNIALFGFMGVGKTSVGRLLSELLEMEFVDLDNMIVMVAGMDIPSIFRKRGESGFRILEKKITIEVADKDGLVIACGGGTVLDDENLQALRKNSKMVLLTADLDTILRRVEVDGNTRPLLFSDEKTEPVKLLIEERMPKYLEAADLIVDTSGISVNCIAQEIIKNLDRIEKP
jgi:shikimate kinase